MKWILLMLISTSVIAAAPSTFEEIADQANLPFLNLSLSQRKTAKVRLANGLEAYLISDPSADQSAASLAVGVGSWNDPIEYPGTAHFCEHMLFQGSKKFPDVNAFSTLIADYNGQTNAYTAPERTVYMFSCAHQGFDLTLQHFARFFIDPLFDPSSISRELVAVDQEFAKNIEHDDWREYMIIKETGNPEHPNARFSTGNSQTLARIPQDVLQEWYRNHYSSKKMRLILYSSLPLDILKQKTQLLFAEVPSSSTKNAPNLEQQLTTPIQRGHIIYIKPIKERQKLGLSWELPRDLSLDPAHSAQLFAYALGRAGPHSLYEQLKREGLIDQCAISIDTMGGKENRFFQIDLDLTDRGLKEWPTAVLRCFQAIKGLTATSIPVYLFQEMNKVTQNSYQFQQRQDPFKFVSSLGGSILDEPLATYPKEQLLASSHEPDRIATVARFLTPENCVFTLQADPVKTSVTPDRREHWMGAEYAVRIIPADRLDQWRKAPLHPGIALADPNPYLPSHFDLVKTSNSEKAPLCISQDETGIAYYARLEEFQTPDVVFQLQFLSPEIQPGARSLCLSTLYIDHLTDYLHPTLAAAAKAGLQVSFNLDRNRLLLTLSGFSDKAPLLLQEILKQFVHCPLPSKEQFEIYRSRHGKYFSNGAKDLAFIQAMELSDSLINKEKPTRQEKLAALQNITYEDLCKFQRDLFKESYTEGMFSGNLSLKEAESAWLDVRHLLGSAPFPKERHSQTKILALAEGGPFAIREKTTALGNAVFLRLDLGKFSFEKRAAQEILSAVLKEAFFTELRTKQKTAYIAHSYNEEIELHLFQSFLVQSNSHQPEELLQRFELFLESNLADLVTLIPESRFNTLKQNLIQSLQTRYRNLQDKSALLNLLAFVHQADFSWVEKRISGFENLTYTTFLEETRTFLSRNNRRRLAILFEGKLTAPYSYEITTPSKIEKGGAYLTRSEILAH